MNGYPFPNESESQLMSENESEPEDDGTMPNNVAALAERVVGHRIISAEKRTEVPPLDKWSYPGPGLVLTLDDGTRVVLRDTSDCCAYTELSEFLLHPDKIDHVITGVRAEDGWTAWHIYADAGDVLDLTVGWSPGNPFYYGYGFEIGVLSESAS